MKLFLVFLIFTAQISLAAELSPGKYNCKIYPNSSRNEIMSFNFEYLEDEELRCFETYDDDDDYCMKFFQFEPVSQIDFYLDGLYDGGFGYDHSNGNFIVDSDLDGCDIGRLTLFRKSGFRKGHIISSFHCSGGPVKKNVGDVYCTRK